MNVCVLLVVEKQDEDHVMSLPIESRLRNNKALSIESHTRFFYMCKGIWGPTSQQYPTYNLGSIPH